MEIETSDTTTEQHLHDFLAKVADNANFKWYEYDIKNDTIDLFGFCLDCQNVLLAKDYQWISETKKEIEEESFSAFMARGGKASDEA
jgi:hypothetical protein